MIQIIDKCNRGALYEGRDNGMAFALLKKVKDDTFQTVQPPSPCKDYLAEVVFTERYGVGTEGCGLRYPKKLDIYDEFAYMAIKMLKTKRGGYNYSRAFDKDVELLRENYKNIERLINNLEKQISLKPLTTIEPANDDYFLVKFSPAWCQSTHSISLYSLLLRVMMVATEKDEDAMSFLKQYAYHGGDMGLLKGAIPKIELILKEKKLPPNTTRYSKASVASHFQSPHNNGILNWKSSFEEVALND